MRKLVNGSIVDIKNIELFERAAECAAINRTLSNTLNIDGVELNFPEVANYIKLYTELYGLLPFPLYSIDSDIKYCIAGIYIKKHVEGKLKIWVNNGLFICLDEESKLALGFVNYSWGIVNIEKVMDDNLNIKEYSEEIGFDEFVWVIASILKGAGTADYYKIFMPGFVEACNGQALVMKWELGSILQFGNIPDRLVLKSDKIIDLQTRYEYGMDIFTAGTRPLKDKVQVINIMSGEDAVRNKEIKVYGYDLYAKPVISGDRQFKSGADRLKPAEIYGVNSLFCTLCSIKNSVDNSEFSTFYGAIGDDNLIFCVDNRVFICAASKYTEAKEIARGVEIYSYKNNVVYLVKTKTIAPGIKKESIYSYSVNNGSLRLCKIQFVKS